MAREPIEESATEGRQPTSLAREAGEGGTARGASGGVRGLARSRRENRDGA